MERTYKFNEPEDMVALAREIQTSVYWSSHYHIGEESIRADEFWSLCSDALQEGYKGVSIKGDTIKLVRE